MFFENIIGKERPLFWAVQFWPVLAGSWICAFAATWLCKKIAIKFDIVDKPDGCVKTHKEPVAYLGGLGILTGLVVGILTGLYCIHTDEFFSISFKWLIGILSGAAISCFVGVVDDILDISPAKKLLGQVIASAGLIIVGILPALDFLLYPFNLSLPREIEIAIGIPVVIFFVLGATNSLNLLDGLDGLCAGVTGIITIAFLLLAIHLGTWKSSNHGDSVRIIICLSLVGGVFGFLPFNRHPAKIFMGDAGSLLLGFCIAALMILFGETTPRWWISSIVVFGLPILDTATALARRFLNHKPLMVSDRGHIYDQMIDRGIPLRKTVKICYSLAAIYAIVGLTMSQIRTRYAIIVYVTVLILSGFVVWRKGFLLMEGLRGAIRKDPGESDE